MSQIGRYTSDGAYWRIRLNGSAECHLMMTREEAIKLLKTDVPAWNDARNNTPTIPSLDNADLGDARLRGANLFDANLRSANLFDADLSFAVLDHANLSGASLQRAGLSATNLSNADLSDARLSRARLGHADLSDADLSYADLSDANLGDANLGGANLRGANLRDANLVRTKLDYTKLSGAVLASTVFANVDLSYALDLLTIDFGAPCTVGVDTLVASRGRIPASFLAGCGFLPWQIQMARLFDPDLELGQVADIQNEMYNLRADQFPWAGGIFISYAHSDGQKLVDKLYERLKSVGFPVWLDRHELTSGPTQKQVDRAIRFNDVVLLVLSEASVESDWVEHELKVARRKEKAQDRNVLCPVALDGSWKSKVLVSSGESKINWEHLGDKNVLDFSKWKTKAFGPVFDKLVRGLKNWYGPAAK